MSIQIGTSDNEMTSIIRMLNRRRDFREWRGRVIIIIRITVIRRFRVGTALDSSVTTHGNNKSKICGGRSVGRGRWGRRCICLEDGTMRDSMSSEMKTEHYQGLVLTAENLKETSPELEHEIVS